MFGKLGEITKDADGLLICHICGKSFRKLGAHSWLKHKIKTKEYKEMFGLCQNTKLTSSDYSKKMKEYWEEYEDIQLENLSKGSDTRYVDSDERIPKKRKLSKQRYNQLVESVKKMRGEE